MCVANGAASGQELSWQVVPSCVLCCVCRDAPQWCMHMRVSPMVRCHESDMLSLDVVPSVYASSPYARAGEPLLNDRSRPAVPRRYGDRTMRAKMRGGERAYSMLGAQRKHQIVWLNKSPLSSSCHFRRQLRTSMRNSEGMVTVNHYLINRGQSGTVL